VALKIIHMDPRGMRAKIDAIKIRDHAHVPSIITVGISRSFGAAGR